jgi:hypothetical protein
MCKGVKILDGQLEETIKNNENKLITIFNINDISYMHDDYGIHKIMALKKSYSLHIYSPPRFYN